MFQIFCCQALPLEEKSYAAQSQSHLQTMLGKLRLNSVIPATQKTCFRAYSREADAAKAATDNGEKRLGRSDSGNNFSFSADEFRVLNLRKTSDVTQTRQKRPKPPDVPPPRFKQMAVDQDWGAVWPGPRSFHPATVPLPLRQGFVKPNRAPPGKFANAELMKIPNFLHLTPPVISKQCENLKKFCTPWPKGLETEEKQEKHFPVRVISSDYVHGLPTIRNPLSRIVTIKLKLDRLNLDKHARDKFLRLVGERYNAETEELTIVTDRCPLKKQNYDYAIYLLTGKNSSIRFEYIRLLSNFVSALYHESNTEEDWEKSKCEADMETYYWDRNRSKVSATEILNWQSTSDQKIEPPQEYGKTVEDLLNEGENEYNLNKYKEQVVKMFGIA